VILPTHTDLQKKLPEFELEATYARFHRDIVSIGKTLDFNFPNTFTRDVSNFRDPYHVEDPAVLIEAIWGSDARAELFRRYGEGFVETTSAEERSK
jgi:hypothetical protein